MIKLKQTKNYDQMDKISWMRVGRKYVYVIIKWIDGEEKYKITRKKMQEYLDKYNFEDKKFYSTFDHALSMDKRKCHL